jgi:hypothetical protein
MVIALPISHPEGRCWRLREGDMHRHGLKFGPPAAMPTNAREPDVFPRFFRNSPAVVQQALLRTLQPEPTRECDVETVAGRHPPPPRARPAKSSAQSDSGCAVLFLMTRLAAGRLLARELLPLKRR